MGRAKGTQNKTWRGLEKHVYRPRRTCRGNAEYERLMAEAQVEFDRQMQQRKTSYRGLVRKGIRGS